MTELLRELEAVVALLDECTDEVAESHYKALRFVRTHHAEIAAMHEKLADYENASLHSADDLVAKDAVSRVEMIILRRLHASRLDGYTKETAEEITRAIGNVRAMDVDSLAQEIRRVDGTHSLGASALAEALMPFITSGNAQAMKTEKAREALKNLENLAISEYEGCTSLDGYMQDVATIKAVLGE